MGKIDAKDVCFMVWKILRFSTNTIFRYVRRYPIVSGVSMFLIVLYTFLPWVFYFLLCSSPLIAFGSFYIRNHHLSTKIGDEDKRTDRGLSSVSQEGRTEKAKLKHQQSVRRNARRKVEEVGKDWDSSQASEDERGKVILTTLYGEVLPETISSDMEKFKRERTLLVAEETSFNSVVELDSLERLISVDGDESEIECSSLSSEEEEREEEERREDIGKIVVPWTEDDQKNLMDLGISEIERNKRLENLISRRRSRRFFLLAAEGSLMDMEVPRICIGRNFYDFDKGNYEIDGLLMPSSAPSVLLPRRNPFDLPYDPLEEKPNLTGDSFQQEFAENNPKDIFFCRHESFHHRIFPSESQKDSKLTSLWRNTVDGRPKPLQGSNDQAPLMKERGKGNDMEAGEVRIETDSIRNDDSDSNASLSPRERDKDFNASYQSDASGTFCKRNDRLGNSVAGLVPRGSGSSSLATERQRYMEHFGYSTRMSHMVTHSVDSDLQVEVSELGSPPTSVDGNDSDYERSLFVYESEIGKEMGFNGGESEVLLVGKDYQDLNEEARKLESKVPQSDEELKELPENSADEIKISYDSVDEHEPSERTDQEFEEPYERNDGEEMQQLAEAEASDVNHHGNSEESVTSPRSVLPDMMLHLDQTHSEVLDHTSDGQLQNVVPPAESSHYQLDERIETTEETTIETVCSDATGTFQENQEGFEVTFNDESNSAEDHRQSINPLAVELKDNETDGIN
ncbi:unnamed protein product [Arabidopsis lyrata]|uniref:Uncharacterized protein n=1 Tax=Arabidopsis lyrata subsp. lyrata TaxID=81972 RepID=D7LLB2_ARALL|nr:uncharacterized protein LOC9315290 [Arabidopsis lyrata subsp. lyrata]EFH57319.1 hypothetical protein ARALYDRAFT_344726 [Arabidopsis lyrata subsp. lyrata]CAH8264151.1 unnamed protein product [Arabidopsis lyrata]|eukprot:XP_002881060.1 uncharacterized protein LOC9315290 [Arabidopsis lyrata subsp. lyrata]